MDKWISYYNDNNVSVVQNCRDTTEIVEYKLKGKLNDFFETPPECMQSAVWMVEVDSCRLHRLMFQTQFKQKQLKSGLMEPRSRCCSKLHILSTLEFLNINFILLWWRHEDPFVVHLSRQVF